MNVSRAAFYKEWAKRAAVGTYGRADLLAGAIVGALSAANLLIPNFPKLSEGGDVIILGCSIAFFIIWRVIRVPYEIWAEKVAELEAVSARVATEEQRIAVLNTIGNLIESGNAIIAGYLSDKPLDEVNAHKEAWFKFAVPFMEKNFDRGTYAHFMSDTAILMGEPQIAEERKPHWRWVAYRVHRLQQILARH